MNKYLAILIGSLFLTPASNAADFCYADGTSLWRLSLTGRCNGRGNDRFSPISGKIVFNQFHLPVTGSCISNRSGIRISLSAKTAGIGLNPVDFILDGSNPRSNLNGVVQIAPFNQPGAPLSFTRINCQTVPQTSLRTSASLPISENTIDDLPTYIQPSEE